MRRTVVGLSMALALVAAAVPVAVVAQDAEKPKVLVWTDAVRQPGFEAYRDSVADTVDVTVELVAQAEILPKIQLANQAGSGHPDVVFAQPNEIAIYRVRRSTTRWSGRPSSPARDSSRASATPTAGV